MSKSLSTMQPFDFINGRFTVNTGTLLCYSVAMYKGYDSYADPQ